LRFEVRRSEMRKTKLEKPGF
jgi:hypothetical protein